MKSELEALGREARALLDPGPAGAPPTAFLDRADGTTKRRRVRVAAGMLLLVLTVGFAWVWRSEPDGAVTPVEVARSPAAGPSARVLVDGTVVEPTSSTVLEVDETGPAPVVRLGDGRVVVRTGRAAPTTLSWGRWVIHLTSSARFAADTSKGAGSLVVLEGSVELRDGAVTRVVRAGEQVELSMGPAPAAPSSPSVLPATAPPSPATPPPSRPEPVRPTRATPPAADARTLPTAEPAPSWSEWVAEGRSAAVLEAALPRLDQVLRTERADALGALADASRFVQRFDVSERACAAVRTRFPGTSEAAHARFMQGRLAEHRGDVGAALSHYEAYVQEAPMGPLAAEAFARRVQLEADRGDADRACTLAKEYLSRFPAGSLAPQFRKRCGLD
jgi:hypothetical protein